MSIISRTRMLRVRWDYSDNLILMSTSRAKDTIKKWVLWKNKSGKHIRFIKTLKILRCTMGKKRYLKTYSGLWDISFILQI